MPKLIDDTGGSARKWHVGETRTITTKDGARSLTITRSSRSFAEDWVDAANEADRERLLARGLVWVAHRDGYTQLREVKHMSKRDLPTGLVREVQSHWQERETEPA